MVLEKPKNPNYVATVVEIQNTVPIPNADNLVHTNIFGNMVVIGKNVKIGDIGLFFPIESELSFKFLSINNLFRDKTLNDNKEIGGFFEQNRRIRAVKLRGAQSMGFFIPLDSLSWTKGDIDSLKVGDFFDKFNGEDICQKYIIPGSVQSSKQKAGKGRLPKVSILVENQFRLHYDTMQLGKNIHNIQPTDIISITQKVHGTSLVSSKILCNRKLSIIDKVLIKLGVPVKTQEYRNIYSSRNVIKNDYLNDSPGFYDVDIWGLANNKLKTYLTEGMTIYAEILGYLPSGKMIQNNYDYGNNPGEFSIAIYRITITNPSGNVYEFSAKQVQVWCKEQGLQPVQELYYGAVPQHENPDEFLNYLKETYLEKKCWNCKNNVPDEGVVLRVDSLLTSPAYKLKSFSFFEQETKELDKGIVSIEDIG